MDLSFTAIADWASILGILITIATLVNTLRISRSLAAEKKRQAQPINVELKKISDGKVQALPFAMRRSEFNRAEILGRIGMIPIRVPTNRFHIKHLNTQEFYEEVNRIADANGSATLTIPCDDDEFTQFAISPE